MNKAAASSLAYSLTWEHPASPNGNIRFYKVCTNVWEEGGVEEEGVASEEGAYTAE